MDESVIVGFGTVYGSAYRSARERGESPNAAKIEASDAVRDFHALLNALIEDEAAQGSGGK